MSRDAKNSIFLWIGTLVFFGLFWAALRFDIGAGIPDRWLWPVLGGAIIVNLVHMVWGHRRHPVVKGR